jgi:predicted NAD/FAD-binding protein
MTLKERCQAGEAKLEQVSSGLLDPRPETLDRCEADLQEVIALLESETADSSRCAADRIAEHPDLMRLRRRILLLALQAQQATNLCQGWAQLGLSEGYTDQGRPVLPPSEPQSSYEV